FFDSDIDTTIFVFNSPGGNGFAVISADARIPQQVLAYSETGNLELDSDNPAFDVFLSYATDYAAECIAKAQEQRDSIEAAIMEKLGIEIDLDTVGTLSKTKHVIQKFLITSMCYTNINVETLAEVEPLITTNWYQRSPYNDLVGGDECEKGNAAGCVAIAASQLIVFWKYPQKINGIRYDWNLLSDDSNISDSKYKDQAAALVSFVGNAIHTDYGCSSSSADVHDARKLFAKMKYNVSGQLIDYKYNKVIKCLDNGWPVMMRGNRTKKKFIVTWYKNGHAWIADGYVHQKVIKSDRLTYAIVEVDDETGRGSCRYEYSGSASVSEPKYLHLNWGWGKASNGYYNQDVFDAKERYVLGDDGRYVRSSVDVDDANYKYNLEFIENLHK
ncbi:MAG: C10 family peptidase, partial [Bacteroidales bacterium]|nr:C10 family peptidase [Bacteroidales bacterium]